MKTIFAAVGFAVVVTGLLCCCFSYHTICRNLSSWGFRWYGPSQYRYAEPVPQLYPQQTPENEGREPPVRQYDDQHGRFYQDRAPAGPSPRVQRGVVTAGMR